MDCKYDFLTDKQENTLEEMYEIATNEEASAYHDPEDLPESFLPKPETFVYGYAPQKHASKKKRGKKQKGGVQTVQYTFNILVYNNYPSKECVTFPPFDDSVLPSLATRQSKHEEEQDDSGND